MHRIAVFLTGLLIVTAGCKTKDHVTRSQIEDDPKETLRTLGDVGAFDNIGGVPISGVGLVVSLDGTGGGTPPGEYRRMLEDNLKRSTDETIRNNVKAVVDSPNHAMVMVSAIIPAGTRRGDPIDVQITLPPGSKAKSLRGGYLLPCELMSYATEAELRTYIQSQNTTDTPASAATGGNRLLKGHVLAKSEGPLQAGPAIDAKRGEVDEPHKHAFIWHGAKSRIDRPHFLTLNPGQDRYRIAIHVADRLNETFHVAGTDKCADPKSKSGIALTPPPAYRLNLPHFMRVVRMIPLEAPEQGKYLAQLEKQLHEPETASVAALRIEALGRTGIPTLRTALKSDYPLVRFAAAESLAYLGEPIAANELGRLAETYPSLEAYCLSALASLDEAASTFALQELLCSARPEVRYGAFRGLQELDPSNESIRGRGLENGLRLYAIAPDAIPLVHLVKERRPEVVVFGKSPALRPPFALRAGQDIIITAKVGDTNCTVSRISASKPERKEQSSLNIVDVVRVMSELGANYAEVAELLILADERKALTCELRLDATPLAVPLKTLSEHARTDPRFEKESDLLKDATRMDVRQSADARP